jgi:hypothetical protein
LQILRGQFICDPPTARSYPYLLEQDASLRLPERAIGYVGFDAEAKAFGGAYLSARYESMVEETDFSVERYLLGQTSLNPEEGMMREHMPDQETWAQIVNDLELERLFGKPVSVLSNGQTRRAKIGKALLKKPQMLCLDAAFSKCPDVLFMFPPSLTVFSRLGSPREQASVSSSSSFVGGRKTENIFVVETTRFHP